MSNFWGAVHFSDGLYYSQKFLSKSLEQYFFYAAVIGFFHKLI